MRKKRPARPKSKEKRYFGGQSISSQIDAARNQGRRNSIFARKAATLADRLLGKGEEAC
jgi:hypothetical protein